MTNTGTWNSDFALFFLFVFFSPIVLFFAVGVLLKILEISMMVSASFPNQLNSIDPEPVLATVIDQQPKPRAVTPKTVIRQEAIEDSEMHLDAVSGLVGIGYKKSEARRIVARACNKKHYQNAEDIITDVISSVYK